MYRLKFFWKYLSCNLVQLIVIILGVAKFSGIDVQAEFLQFANFSHLFGQTALEGNLSIEVHDLDGVVLPDVLDRLQDQVVGQVELDGGHLHEGSIPTPQLLPVGEEGVVQ